MRRHIVLIGLPGAGKSTVGGMLAALLGAAFVDVDEMIEREEGATIREIFAARGEQAFRRIERAATDRLMSGSPSVLAPGGGWAAQPGAMDDAAGRCLIVYLRTRPREAARRVSGGTSRPLIAGSDPEVRIQELLGSREEFYGRAEVTVDTDDRSPEQVAAAVAQLARSKAGW